MGGIVSAIKAVFRRNTTNATSVSGVRFPLVKVDGDPIGNASPADVQALLGEHMFGKEGKIIQANEDLDNILIPNVYCCTSGTTASSLANAPWTNAGFHLFLLHHTH